MNINEFMEQIDFAATHTKDIRDNKVKVIVTLGNKTNVLLDIKEIGFNDKEGVIYIEVGD